MKKSASSLNLTEKYKIKKVKKTNDDVHQFLLKWSKKDEHHPAPEIKKQNRLALKSTRLLQSYVEIMAWPTINKFTNHPLSYQPFNIKFD